MVNTALRSAARKAVAVTMAIAALAAGYLIHGVSDPSSGRAAAKPAPTVQLTASDLQLIASGAEGIHLRFPGVSGASTTDHANDVPISSFQFGVGRGVSAPPDHVPGVPSISDITLTHETDRYSTKLLNLALRGTSDAVTHSPTASLFFTDLSGPGGTAFDFMKIDIQEALISGFSMSSGGGLPSESLSLSFSNVMTVTTHIPYGTTQTVTYNLTTQS